MATTETGVRTTARRAPPGLTVAVGGFYTCMGGVHVGLVAADPGVYRSFADEAFLGLVRTGWAEVFMAAPTVWVCTGGMVGLPGPSADSGRRAVPPYA